MSARIGLDAPARPPIVCALCLSFASRASPKRSPQYGHPAHRDLAQGEEERILFTYQPFLERAACPRPDRSSSTRVNALVFEAYRAGGELLTRAQRG